jgi:site-specific DNA recombinase
LKRKRSGGTPLTKSAIYKILRNPFYYGLIERKHDGKLMTFRGSHSPMITEEEFWKVQKIMGRPVPRPQRHSFAYAGMIECGECGGMFSAYEKVKKSGRRYIYYRCSKKSNTVECHQNQLTEKMIEDQVCDVLSQMTIPQEFANWAIKWLRYINKDEIDNRLGAREGLQKAYNDSQTKIDKLTDLFLGELIDQDEYIKRKNELTKSRDLYKAKLDDKEQEANNWIVKVEDIFNFAKSAKKRFEETDDVDVKKDIVRSLGSNYVLKDGILTINLEKVWQLFVNFKPQLDKGLSMCELAENGQFKETTPAFADVISSWQGR